ncbi:MAG: amidohydrolase family protein [Deltaproteobacteria bacterium]|nr:amidohydrolase family protein [Deltaproteobacteria bacterium]
MCSTCRNPAHRLDVDLTGLDLTKLGQGIAPTPLQLNIAASYGVDFTPATAKTTAEQLESYGRRPLKRIVQQYADTVIQNAKVHTMNPNQPHAEAVAINGNQIGFVGSNDDAAQRIGPHTRVIDAKGQTLTPGFQDTHAHLLYIVELLSWTQVRGLNKKETIKALQDSEPINGWIRCFGTDLDTNALSRDEIDAALKKVGKDHIPVYMETETGEWSAVNTPAIKRIEETHQIDIEGPHKGMKGRLQIDGNGFIELDAKGRPTGHLRYANVLVHAAPDGKSEGPMPCAKYDDIKDHLKTHLEYFAANGITQFHNAMSTLPELEIYRQYELDRGLPMRIYSSHGMSQFKIHTEVDKEFLNRMIELREKYNTDLFNVGGVKFNVSGHSGPSYSLDELTTFIKRLNKAGIQAWIHAIDQAEIELCLRAFKAADPKGQYKHIRHRIEHFCEASAKQVARAVELGVASAVQPPWGFPAPAAKKNGMVTGLSTDWNVIPDISPQEMMAEAMGLGLSSQEAVERYTVHPAIASHTEDRLGMLQEGKLADMVLWSRDITQARTPGGMLRAKVAMTIVDGQVVHRDPKRVDVPATEAP